MTRKIQLKRGLEKDLPRLDTAELGFTTDSKKAFIGSDTGNVELAKKDVVDAMITSELASTVKKVNGKTPVNGEINIEIPEVDTSALATKTELGDLTQIPQSNIVAALKDTSAQLVDTVKKVNGKVPVNGEVIIDVPQVDTSKLATKTEINDISIGQINKNKGKFDQTFFTPETIQQWTGNTPVNGIPARESIVRGQLTRNIITPELLSFTEKPNNLFNKNDVLNGFSIGSTTGELVENSAYAVTDFLYVKPSQSYVTKNIVRYAYYDQAKKFLSSATTASFTTPENAYFMRFCSALGSNLSTAQINEGATLLPYDQYEYKLKSNKKNSLIISPSARTVEAGTLKENVVEPSNTTFLVSSTNVFNKGDVQLNKSINADGTIADDSSRVLGDFIGVNPSDVYSSNPTITFRIAFYDRDKNFISRIIKNIDIVNFTILSEAHWMRVSPTTLDANLLMINKGNTLLPYEEYKFTLKSTLKNPLIIDPSLLPNGTGQVEGGGNGDLGEQHIYSDSSGYSTNQSKIICDIPTKSTVDIIEFSANNMLACLEIQYKTPVGDFVFDLVSNDGSTSLANTFENMQLHGSSIIEFIEFDDVNKKFKVYAKNLIFANGFKIVCKNTATTNANITVRVVSRQYV